MSYDAKVIQVIVTDLDLRGRGTGAGDIARRVTQYWTLDGELLAEVDPCPSWPTVSSEHINELREILESNPSHSKGRLVPEATGNIISQLISKGWRKLR